MIVDHGPVLQLLDLDDLLLLARLGGLLLLLIFVFAVVEDLDDRRGRIGRDLDQVEAGFLRGGERVGDRNGAFVGAVLLDQMDFADANLLVDARPILAGRLLGSHRATNGEKLLCCCDDPAYALRPIGLRLITRRNAKDRYKAGGSQRRTVSPGVLCGRSWQIDQPGGRARRLRRKAPASRGRRSGASKCAATQARPRAPIAGAGRIAQ